MKTRDFLPFSAGPPQGKNGPLGGQQAEGAAWGLPLSTAVLAAALAGCAGTPAQPPRPPGECDAGPAHIALGRTITPGVREEARKASGAEIVRVLTPGEVITMEYNPKRLNLQLNRDNVVARATCG